MSRILVVEDNEFSARLMRDVLSFRGHEVVEASTLEAARALLHDADPDLILTDLRLPDGTGDELLRAVREDPKTAALPVVVVTASVLESEREQIVAQGFDGYVTKPINLTTFERDLDRWLALGASRAGAAPAP
jgi:CheY-like chemotaxis protein